MTQELHGDSTQPAPLSEEAGMQNLQLLGIRFTGSGSEYFRIWIVNLLLILVTFSLYLPFARARRLAYFHRNTVVGEDPLAFHGNPWKMFQGYLFMLVLGVSYWAVSSFAPMFSLLPLLLLGLLWPALWRASLQFKLSNTSWRGVRMAFEGDLKGAYACLLPFLLALLPLALAQPLALLLSESEFKVVFSAVVGLTLLVFLFMLPWLMARLKRYQHGGFRYTQEQAVLLADNLIFYKLALHTAGVLFFCLLVLVGGVGAAMALSVGMLREVGLLVLPIGVLLAYLVVPLVMLPYITSRLQNLLWSRTRSENVRFESRLKFLELMKLSAVNGFLILVTLGLYWPFAKVRNARLRLQAVSLNLQGDVNEWRARYQTGNQGILGDAAGDFLGLDMGV
jgi:uncharacterized membrane protein YjgN (DUF898 family)